MQEILLSVVIPIYNVELYLQKCVESVLRQTYHNLEVLLVDDGSVDNSGKICDAFAKKDARVRVFHQKNKGALQARIYGVTQARGEVVTFVDSDDWMEEDMYQSMMEVYNREQPDLLSTGYTLVDEEGKFLGKERELLEDRLYSGKEIEMIIQKMMWCDEYNRYVITPSLWNKFFKLKQLKEVIERIDIELTWGDDAAIVYPYLFNTSKLSIINGAWYHYVDRSKSMTKRVSWNVFEKILRLEEYFMRVFDNSMDYQIKQYIKILLRIVLKSVYDVSMEKMNYVFPYENIPKGSRVILYGAGKVGKSYWNMITHGKYVSLVSWVDRFYDGTINGYYKIEDVASIKDKKFDYIIIAIDNEMSVEEIRLWLMENNIPEEKIFWKKPTLVE